MPLAECGSYDKALAAFESSLRLAPDNETALQEKANMLLHLRRYEEALMCYELLLNHFQATLAVLCGKGHALFAFGRYLEALATYEQAITLFPEIAYPYHYKSIVLIKLMRYQEAFEACTSSIAINPRESSFYLNMTRIHERLYHDLKKEHYKYEEEIIDLEVKSELVRAIAFLSIKEVKSELVRAIAFLSIKDEYSMKPELVQAPEDLQRLPHIPDTFL